MMLSYIGVVSLFMQGFGIAAMTSRMVDKTIMKLATVTLTLAYLALVNIWLCFFFYFAEKGPSIFMLALSSSKWSLFFCANVFSHFIHLLIIFKKYSKSLTDIFIIFSFIFNLFSWKVCRTQTIHYPNTTSVV